MAAENRYYRVIFDQHSMMRLEDAIATTAEHIPIDVDDYREYVMEMIRKYPEVIPHPGLIPKPHPLHELPKETLDAKTIGDIKQIDAIRIQRLADFTKWLSDLK